MIQKCGIDKIENLCYTLNRKQGIRKGKLQTFLMLGGRKVMHFALVRKGGIGRLPKIQFFEGFIPGKFYWGFF